MTSNGRLPGPPALAQAGYLRRIFRDPQPVLDELAAAYGPLVGMGFGPVRMAIVGNPTALKELFATPPSSFKWGHKFNVLGFVVGDGSLIVSDGADYKRRRSSVQAAFSRRRLNQWIPTIVEQADATIDALRADIGDGSTTLDMAPVVHSMVLAVTVRAFFGDRFADRSEEIGRLFQGPQDYLESPAIRQFPHPFPFGARARVRADRRALDRIIDVEIAELRRTPADDPLDVLGSLVADGTLSDAEIRDQVVTLLGAGYDTTAASLSWMLWCTSLAPEVWTELRREADAVLGPIGATQPRRDAEMLRGLTVADRVMRETLRLHPAGVIAPRQAAVDLSVGGHVVPKGTLVLWSAHLAGRDPTSWTDPLRFDPNRFEDPTPDQQAAADLAWVPFGRGARNCIGFALAQMEIILITARLAQRLDVEATAAVLPPPVGMVVNRPRGGVPLRVSART